MIQRIGDTAITFVIENEGDFSSITVRLARDLRDARARILEVEADRSSIANNFEALIAKESVLEARIAELEALSASQEQAHAMRDAGGRV